MLNHLYLFDLETFANRNRSYFPYSLFNKSHSKSMTHETTSRIQLQYNLQTRRKQLSAAENEIP